MSTPNSKHLIQNTSIGLLPLSGDRIARRSAALLSAYRGATNLPKSVFVFQGTPNSGITEWARAFHQMQDTRNPFNLRTMLFLPTGDHDPVLGDMHAGAEAARIKKSSPRARRAFQCLIGPDSEALRVQALQDAERANISVVIDMTSYSAVTLESLKQMRKKGYAVLQISRYQPLGIAMPDFEGKPDLYPWADHVQSIRMFTALSHVANGLRIQFAPLGVTPREALYATREIVTQDLTDQLVALFNKTPLPASSKTEPGFQLHQANTALVKRLTMAMQADGRRALKDDRTLTHLSQSLRGELHDALEEAAGRVTELSGITVHKRSMPVFAA